MTEKGLLARAKLKADAKMGDHKALGATVEHEVKMLDLREQTMARQRLHVAGWTATLEAEHPNMTKLGNIIESHHTTHDMFYERWVEGTVSNLAVLKEILEAKKALDKDSKELAKMRTKVEKAQKALDGNKKPAKQAQLEGELEGAKRDCDQQEEVYSGVEKATMEKCDAKLGEFLLTDSENWVAYLRSTLETAEKRHGEMLAAIKGESAKDKLLAGAADAKAAAQAKADAGKAKLSAMAGGGGAMGVVGAGMAAAKAKSAPAAADDGGNPFDDEPAAAGGGDPPSKDGHPILCKAKCTTDFDAEEDGEMSMKAGDTIEIFQKHDDGWWEGRNKGKEGLIPMSYLEVL